MEHYNEENKYEETQIKGEKSGGATIVDFNYEKYAEVEHKETHTDATAALVFGILALVFDLFGALFGIILGIVGIVFGLKGRADVEKQGMATAGLVLAILGTVLGVLKIIVSICFFAFYAVDFLNYF